MAKGKGMDPGRAGARGNEKNPGMQADKRQGGEVLPAHKAKPEPKVEPVNNPNKK